jgi:hypothetical protein
MARLASKAAALALLLAFSPSAFAMLEQVGAGVTLPQPLSSQGELFNRPLGGAAQLWLKPPSFFPESVSLSLSGEFLPFQLKSVGPSGSIKLNLYMIGGYAGFTLWGNPSFLGMRPYFSAQMGALYDYLTIPGSSGAISNTGTAFALRAAPGLDFPLVSGLGVMVELPITVAFFKSTLSIWESTFSLRWKL